MTTSWPEIMTVRRLIADLDPAEQLLTDLELQGFLDINDGDVRLAAAEALETIAVSELLVSKRIRTQDLSTDGVAVSAELRALAARLRDAARAADDGWAMTVATGATGATDGRRPEATNHEVWGL